MFLFCLSQVRIVMYMSSSFFHISASYVPLHNIWRLWLLWNMMGVPTLGEACRKEHYTAQVIWRIGFWIVSKCLQCVTYFPRICCNSFEFISFNCITVWSKNTLLKELLVVLDYLLYLNNSNLTSSSSYSHVQFCLWWPLRSAPPILPFIFCTSYSCVQICYQECNCLAPTQTIEATN